MTFNFWVLVQLSLLTLSYCFSTFGMTLSPASYPTPNRHPIIKPPVQSPMYPPVQGPTSHGSPHHFPKERRFLAVQGIVYCLSYKYANVHSLQKLAPIPGAKVRLTCHNTWKRPVVEEAKTDKNGDFFIQGPKNVTTYAFHKCRVELVSSRAVNCSQPTNINGGLKGAFLRPVKPFMINDSLYFLYSVGPFVFAPKF